MDIVAIRKLNMLLQLAHADRHFDDAERDLIRRIALQKSIPASAIDEMLLHPISVDSLGALSEDQKMDYLLTAVELILVDGRIDPSEVRFAKSLALKLGFRIQVVDFLTEAFNKTPRQELQRVVYSEYLAS
ncbi:MAG TPA: hypothetical protein PLX35_12540 [Cyclobacteriaceae bacterium]|nr:hypothetical protein [Cyclobacteriaceae bacterium]